jgi:hypothetical protein
MYDTLMKEFQDVETPNSALLMQHAYRKVVASSDTSAFRSSVLIAFEMALGSRTVRDAVASILASHASTGVLDSWKLSSILMWCIAELNTAQAEEAVSMIYRAYPTDKPTLLAFVSETCSPCMQLLEEIGQSIHRFGGANFIIVPIGEWHVNSEK